MHVRLTVALLLVFPAELYALDDVIDTVSRPKPFSVQLVDVDGKPVPDADVGLTAWVGEGTRESAAKDNTQWWYPKHVRSNAAGIARFESGWEEQDGSIVVARHERSKLMAIGEIDTTRFDKPIRLTLVPEVEIVGNVVCQELAARRRKLDGIAVTVYLRGKRVIASSFPESAVCIALPPGNYEMLVHSFGSTMKLTHRVGRPLQVKDQKQQRLEPIELPATRLALLIGQPAPELPDATAWKNGPAIRLADLRGKVVLLDFWGWWCGPCVEGMPELFRLHEEYRDRGLAIVGIHVDWGEDPVDSPAKLEARLTKTNIRQTLWKGRDIPFPVAFLSGNETEFHDASKNQALGVRYKARGEAAAVYGIKSYPTLVLIDRRGKVVGSFDPSEKASVELLERTLHEP